MIARPALVCALSLLPLPGQGTTPLTKAESSGWQETSRYEDVVAFIDRLKTLEDGDRIRVETFGESHEGRKMLCVIAASPMLASAEAMLESGKLRILINGNIHAGEVEGKEAAQQILREITKGGLADILEKAILLFVPIYNADGNERIDKHNRSSQNGPNGGVGSRPNAQDLDLNRDFIKAESPECRALLGLLRTYDPHLFIDLHTTNGSNHGYHLTYAPSLSTNVSPRIDAFMRNTFLPEVRAKTKSQQSFRIFDYGNFTRRGERRFTTYDHRPRFGTNYYGLRNRFSLLSEAYSYLAFAERVAVTRAFITEVLDASARHSAEIRAICVAADTRMMSADAPIYFGHETSLGPAEDLEILTRELQRVELPGDLGTRIIAVPGYETETLPVQRAFRSSRRFELPWAWAIAQPTETTLATLQLHGVTMHRLKSAARVGAEVYAIAKIDRAKRRFQGHHEVSLTGAWRSQQIVLPVGTCIIPGRQRLGRLAAQLLAPESEDSLSTWEVIEVGNEVLERTYPVVRLRSRIAIGLDGSKRF